MNWVRKAIYDALASVFQGDKTLLDQMVDAVLPKVYVVYQKVKHERFKNKELHAENCRMKNEIARLTKENKNLGGKT